MGVQFRTPSNYSQLHAGGVWELFRKDYPKLEEHEPLPQALEVFGSILLGMPSFELLSGPRHDRFWFVAKNPDELIQFQNNRIHFNWRSRPEISRPYPRFDYVCSKFFDAFDILDAHLLKEFGEGIQVVQSEISYINHFPYLVGLDTKSISDWVNIIDTEKFSSEDINLKMRHPLLRDGEPYARVNLEIASALKPPNDRIFVLTTTVRGCSVTVDKASLREFFEEGSSIIVNNFNAITTEWAHSYWNRTE